MAKGFARIELVGNLGDDPKLNTVKSKKNNEEIDVMNAKLAVNVDENTVQWFSVELWGKRAKAAVEHLKKGSKVFISDGTLLEPETWTGEDGKPRVEMKVRVNDWHWMDSGNKKEVNKE